MKIALALLMTVASLSTAKAADSVASSTGNSTASSICKTVAHCGSYTEGPYENGTSLQIDFLETSDPKVLDFAWKNLKNGVDIGGGVKLKLKFEDDGSFIGFVGSKVYAAGVCRNYACTYGITPVTNKDGSLRAQTGTFHFVNDKLELSVFIPNMSGDDFSSKGTLDKLK